MAHKVGNGAIIGITSEDGIATSKRIALIDRTNMHLVGHTVSDEFGAYVFSGLDPSSSDYLVFAVDDDGDPKKAALIFDYVKPIPAHQGGFFWSNWYYIAMQKEPTAMAIPILDRTFSSPFLAAGVFKYADPIYSSSLIANQASITPGAANLPAMTGLDISIRMGALGRKSSILSTNSFAAELVIDTSKSTRNVSAYLMMSNAPLSGFSNPYALVLLGLRYQPATNSFVVAVDNGLKANNQNTTANDELKLSITYVLPPELVGTVVHAACSVTYGGVASLFINGALVQTSSFIAANEFSPPQNSYIHAIIGSDEPTTTNSIESYDATEFKISLLAFYTDAMTEQEAKTHYDALFGEMLPQVTGYAKSVIEDYPTHYFRLADTDDSVVMVDYLRQNKRTLESRLEKISQSSLALTPSKSIVLGGSGTEFSGGYGSNQFASSVPFNRNLLTVEFTARPAASRSSYGSILSSMVGSTMRIDLGVATDNVIQIGFTHATTSGFKAYKSTVTMDTTKTRHYAIVLDTSVSSIKIYIDAVLSETITLDAGSIMALPEPSIATATPMTVGARNGGTFRYYGFLAELAIYQYALSQQAISKHYEARLIV